MRYSKCTNLVFFSQNDVADASPVPKPKLSQFLKTITLVRSSVGGITAQDEVLIINWFLLTWYNGI